MGSTAIIHVLLFQGGIDFRGHILTSTDVRFWRLKSVKLCHVVHVWRVQVSSRRICRQWKSWWQNHEWVETNCKSYLGDGRVVPESMLCKQLHNLALPSWTVTPKEHYATSMMGLKSPAKSKKLASLIRTNVGTGRDVGMSMRALHLDVLGIHGHFPSSFITKQKSLQSLGIILLWLPVNTSKPLLQCCYLASGGNITHESVYRSRTNSRQSDWSPKPCQAQRRIDVTIPAFRLVPTSPLMGKESWTN